MSAIDSISDDDLEAMRERIRVLEGENERLRFDGYAQSARIADLERERMYGYRLTLGDIWRCMWGGTTKPTERNPLKV